MITYRSDLDGVDWDELRRDLIADEFHNGPKFNDYFELRDIIAGREPDFARGFTEHLIGYGLGRPFGFTDEDLADEIVGAAKEEDFAVSAFVQALVTSEAFRRK